MDVNNLTLKIAGKDFRVEYKLSDAREIEAFAAQPGRSFLEMTGGTTSEKLAIVWGGLKCNNNRYTKRLIDVEELLQEHQKQGGRWHRDIFMPCAQAGLLSGLGGDIDEEHIESVMRHVRAAAGLGAGEDPGGNAVKAAE